MAGSAMAGYKRLQGEGYMLIKASETCLWLLALFRLKGMSGGEPMFRKACKNAGHKT